MNEFPLIHNKEENRYEYHIEGLIAYIEYEENDNILDLTHTIVPKALGGRGIAKNLCIDVMAEVEKNGQKIKPACSYIVAFIEKNPQYQNLVA